MAKRRYPQRRGGVVKTLNGVANVAYKALRIGKTIGAMMGNVERKYKDTAIANTAQTTTPVITLLNGMSQGDTSILRQGDSVKFLKLSIISNVQHNSIGNASQWLRYMIVYDRQPNGAIFTHANLLDSTTSPFSFRQLDYKSRFSILYDRVIPVTSGGGNASVLIKKTINLVRYLKKSRKYKIYNNHTDYGLGNAGTIADISTGSYYLFTMADTATNGAYIGTQCRMRFIDN